MSDTPKCPKCGAESYPPVYGKIGSTRVYWLCGSHSEGKQSDECRIVELTARIRELEAAALATAAQIAELQGRLAEAERELQESCGGPLPADFDVVAFLVSRGWKYNGP